MTKKTLFNFAGTPFLFITAGIFFFTPINAGACGYGNAGGSDFVPQKQSPYGGSSQAAAIGQDQAKDIVNGHVSKLNPDLGIGSINDAGGFFEVEVINKAAEVVQLLGVDKYSGRLMLLN